MGRKVQCPYCQGKFVVDTMHAMADRPEEAVAGAATDEEPEADKEHSEEAEQEVPSAPAPGPNKMSMQSSRSREGAPSPADVPRRSSWIKVLIPVVMIPIGVFLLMKRSTLDITGPGESVVPSVLSEDAGGSALPNSRTNAVSQPVPSERETSSNLPAQKELDFEILARDLTPVGSAAYQDSEERLEARGNGDGFKWVGRVGTPGRYQVWVTYYSPDNRTRAQMVLNGSRREKSMMNMARDQIRRFYDENGQTIATVSAEKKWVEDPDAKPDKRGRKRKKRITIETELPVPNYYFREYWGTCDLSGAVDLRMTFTNDEGTPGINVHAIDFAKEDRYADQFEALLLAAIGFYTSMHESDDTMVRCAFDIGKGIPRDTTSIAVCGQALMAHAMNHELGRDPRAEEKALALLRIFNGKHSTCRPERDSTGLFRHFMNYRTGAGRSEFSTIDTSILACGALFARNTFSSPSLAAEADELFNSIQWRRIIDKPDPSSPAIFLTGEAIDDPVGVSNRIFMFNEYYLVCWLCHHAEIMNTGRPSGEPLLPKPEDLPKAVYNGRILLSNRRGGLGPSFLVQFPFYMTDLCTDERYFSFAAAEAVADREIHTRRYGDRSAWGVGPGATPDQGYAVFGILNHEHETVAPRVVAAFAPVLPMAADDLYLRYKDQNNRMTLPFGEILPRFSPKEPSWRPGRLAGVDFGCLLFGTAALHPGLGMEFFREKSRFSFEKRP